MQIETVVSLSNPGLDIIGSAVSNADIVLYFMSPEYELKQQYLLALREAYPNACLMGCTTGGEIAQNEALEKAAVSVAIKLGASRFALAHTKIKDNGDSYEAGRVLARDLAKEDLRFIFILADGLLTNGSELVRGLTETVPNGVILTGGLAGDGARFKQTGVGINALPESGVIAAAGFYGTTLRVSYGNVGGWNKFGPERLITRSTGSTLYELDDQPALDLYKKYLGEEAKNLPGSGLLFPLSIRRHDSTDEMLRTIIGVGEKEKSLMFAGDVPQGYIAQLMRGNIDNLVDGAEQAATFALNSFAGTVNAAGDCLGLLVSCIGRNLLMGQHVSDEIEAVKRILGTIPLVGFYSYGEICPHQQTSECALHNQAMTITLLCEVA